MKYVDSKELEKTWSHWLETDSTISWNSLAISIYKVCGGVVTQFHPQSEDERNELIHHAYATTLGRIKEKKLTFTPGRAPVFNLLTTTIFRCLYSFKTAEKRRRNKRFRYHQRNLESQLSNCPFHNSGVSSTVRRL